MFKKFRTIRSADGRLNWRAIAGKLVILSIVAKSLLTLGTLGWLVYSTVSDPMHVLPKPDTELVASTDPLTAESGRRVQHIGLTSRRLGLIGITISLPDPMPAGKIPVLMVLGGLGTGEHNIRSVTNAGPNAIIGYDWPIPVRLPDGLRLLFGLPEFYREAIRIPAQIVSALGWILAQDWADSSRVSLLGFSLGALVAPAVQDSAQTNNHAIGWTILAYGGAPLGQVFVVNPNIRPPFMRAMLAPVVDLLLRPLQPQLHLPRLKGNFLIMEGQNDALMPDALRQNLHIAVPEPKEVIVFPGSHMGVGPDQMQLLRSIIDTSRNWLTARGAIGK